MSEDLGAGSLDAPFESVAAPVGSVPLLGPAGDVDRGGARPSWRGGAPGLALALMLHAAVAAALVGESGQPLGGNGIDLEAISVEVALVPATALESRAAIQEAGAAQAGAVDAIEGVAADSVAAAETTLTSEPLAKSQQPAEQRAATAALEQPSSEIAVEPDPMPRDEDAPVFQPPPKRGIAEAHEMPVEPKPMPPTDQKPKTIAPAEARAGSVSQQAGGVASRAVAGEGQARAAASAAPGAIKAFAKGVVEALGRTRPKGLKAGSKGTVKIAFAVADGGGLDFVRVARSSGSTVLDEAAVGAVKRASFPLPPPGLSMADRTYEVPYHFR